MPATTVIIPVMLRQLFNIGIKKGKPLFNHRKSPKLFCFQYLSSFSRNTHIGAAKRSRKAVERQNERMVNDMEQIKVHICPILMRTVRFIDGQCEQSDCLEKEDCLIMIEIQRQEERSE